MPGAETRPLLPGTTRRGFLRLAGTGAALTALSQLRPLAPRALADDASPRFFDATETEILTLAMERVVDSGRADAPRVRDTGAVAAVDALCRGLDPTVTEPLPWLLRLIEYGPFLFDFTFSRFSQMTDAERDASLRAWMESRLALRRLGFAALRNLCFVGWYSQDATWPLIGYRGPLLRGDPPRSDT
jgi:hypothetical protein